VKQRRPVWPWVVFGTVWIAVGVLALLVWLQNGPVLAPQFDSWAPVDSRTLSLRVYVAPCSWTRVTSVVESARAVQVRVESLPCPAPGPGSDALSVRQLTVDLTGDLGARSIEDAAGQPVPQR
jgi:hypothetical protein